MSIFSKSENYAAQDAELSEKLSQIEPRKQAILNDSTQSKLFALETEMFGLIESRAVIRRLREKCLHDSVPSETEIELSAEIRSAADLERAIFAELGHLPERFVRADAVEFFGEARIDARAKADGVLSRYDGLHSTPAGSTLQAGVEADRADSTWHHERPVAEAGEKVFALRAKRAKMIERLEGLKNARVEAVLKAGGFR